MATPYSTRFFGGLITPDDDTVYTVPIGFTAVVQHIDANPTTSLPDFFQVIFVQADSTPLMTINLNSAGSWASVSWSGKLVLNAGDSIQAGGESYDWTAQCSGALLADS